MSRPLIVVMSQQPRWTEELPASGRSGYSFMTCSSLDQLQDVVIRNRPSGVIADLTGTTEGTAKQDQLLEQLRDRRSDLPMAMVTDEVCPEPLKRRALFSGINHLQNPISVQTVMRWLQEKVPSDSLDSDVFLLADRIPEPAVASIESPQSMPPASPSETETLEAVPRESGSVLSGMTRRFETFTPSLKGMLDELAIAAEKDVTLLLIGETGAGKTYLSNLIHEVSPRRNEPFITVACGALPGDLIESELFGHVKGAFTSAHVDKDGKFVAAGRGTILLDEIDVLGPEQQVKLLRVIETGQFEPVGSNKTNVSQARLVVASNLPLEPLVQQGKFRPDLYYRLAMLKFELPPLRRRQPDIKPLAKRFITDKAKKHDVVVHRIEQEFFDSLLTYPWPGNVRELEYAIQRAVIYCRDGVLRASHLPAHILSGVAGPTNDPTVVLDARHSELDSKELGSRLATTEKELIEQALLRNNFNRTRTAKELGVSRVTLYNKMKRYELS